MVRDLHAADKKEGWVFLNNRRGAVVGARRELYARAFVLFSVASFVQATGLSAKIALEGGCRGARRGNFRRTCGIAGDSRDPGAPSIPGCG